MTTSPNTPKSFMPVVGGIVLAAVAVYFLFMAVNSLGLAKQTATATVRGKEYREPGRTYATQPVGGRMLTRMQTTPEMYILKLDVDGRETLCAVDKSLYDTVRSGEQVQVTYRQLRISRSLQVDEVYRQ